MVASTTGNAVYALFSGFVRLLVLGYTALALFAFFEIQALLRQSKDGDSFEIDNGTLFVPLVLCFPSNLKVDGVVIVDSTNLASPAFVRQAECRQLDYLMSACASSLLLSGVACILFVFCDCLARFRCCPFDANSSSGMAMFLSFLLTQTGLSVGALAEQNHYWVVYFKDLIQDQDLNLDVESYAHSSFLIGSAFSSFGIAFLVLIDATCSRCCQCRLAGNTRPEEDETHGRGGMRWMKGTKGIEEPEQIGKNGQHALAVDQANDLEADTGSASPSSSGRSIAITPPWWKV